MRRRIVNECLGITPEMLGNVPERFEEKIYLMNACGHQSLRTFNELSSKFNKQFMAKILFGIL